MLARKIGIVSGILFAALGGWARGQTAPTPTADYLRGEFTLERVLDWGERPVWSSDGMRIAFTRSDVVDGPAYELDLRTRKVRCLTCRWGASGKVTRIYYLPDNSFLITAPAGLDVREAVRGEREAPQQGFGLTELYWMPETASLPPQALRAGVIGEVGLDHTPVPEGGSRIAWGEAGAAIRLMMGDVVHDGSRAVLTNRIVADTYSQTDPSKLPMAEAYDYADGGRSILFFSAEPTKPWNGMYRLNLTDGKTVRLANDGAHSEIHLFPDERFGLEESNRASDPSGPLRGLSGLPQRYLSMTLERIGWPDAGGDAARQGGKKFDLYVHDLRSGRLRRLTSVSDIGGEAHQSSPSRDGRRIVFAMTAPKSGPYAGKGGLYIGTFGPRGK